VKGVSAKQKAKLRDAAKLKAIKTLDEILRPSPAPAGRRAVAAVPPEDSVAVGVVEELLSVVDALLA
jgi:hypothetical protein